MPKWTPKPNPTVAELAWAAGIIDGEGCICVYGRPGRVGKKGVRALALIINVVNTDPRMPLKMCEIFGGHTGRATERRGNPRRRPITQWIITGKPAGSVLVAIRPYLIIKAEQADIALAYAETIGHGGQLRDDIHAKREDLRQRLVLLKGRAA
jgi:hypothetical protein